MQISFGTATPTRRTQPSQSHAPFDATSPSQDTFTGKATPRFAGAGGPDATGQEDEYWGFTPADRIFEQKTMLPPVNKPEDDSEEAIQRGIKWNKQWHKAYLKQEATKLSRELNQPVDSLAVADALESRMAEDRSFRQTQESFQRYILQIRQAKLPADDPTIARTHLALAQVLFPTSSLDTRYSKLLETISDEHRADAIAHYESGLQHTPPSDQAADALRCLAELKYPHEPARKLETLEQAAQMLIGLHGYQWKIEASSHTDYGNGMTLGFSSSGPSRLSDVLWRMKEILETPEGANPELLELVTHRRNYAHGLDELPYIRETIDGHYRSIAQIQTLLERDDVPERSRANSEELLQTYRENLPEWEAALPETEAKIAQAKAFLGIPDEETGPGN